MTMETSKKTRETPERGRRKTREEDENAYKKKDTSVSLYSTWISRIAIFGDSGVALMMSFLLLLTSIAIMLWLDYEASLPKDPYDSLGPLPDIGSPHIYNLPSTLEAMNDAAISSFVTADIQKAFEHDGAIAVRGLIADDLLERLDAESNVLIQQQRGKGKNRKGTQFFTSHHNLLFALGHHEDQEKSFLSAFAEVALFTHIPTVAATLLNITNTNGRVNQEENLCVMRDIFLAKDSEEYICGWHVDDLGFWPATPESPGVNAWIALDDMPVEHGGGFALAIGSHLAPWRGEAQYTTGASTTFPPEGYRNASDMFAKRTGSGTCTIQQSAPHIHKRMEETKRIYNIKRGDVIFHTRWLFHRTVPFTRDYVDQQNHPDAVYRRYSVRYGPGSSVIPPGYGTELSVLWNEANGGRTATDVNQHDASPWYPVAYPHYADKEQLRLGFEQLNQQKIPKALKLQSRRRQEMQPFLRRMAKEQQRKVPVVSS